jgi:NADPH:quinone reductase-like Zn-dependent oxidoreductase
VDDYVKKYTNGEGFDIVYDTVGGTTLDASFEAARIYHGHVVSCLGWGSHALAPLSFRGATYSGVFTLLPLLSGLGRYHHGEILAEAARLVQSGQLTVRLDERNFSFSEVDSAHAVIASGKAKGKVVINVA